MLRLVNGIISSVLMLLVLCACDTQWDDDIYLDGLENIQFDCFEGQSEFYLKGTIGNDSVCVYHGENEYKAYFGIGNGFITLTPNFILGESQFQESKSFIDLGIYKKSEITGFLDEIRINGPPQKFGTPLDSMVRKFLVEGVHSIREKIDEDSISVNGFELWINKWYRNSELNSKPKSIAMTSALGEQPIESHLTINEVKLSQIGKTIKGYIVFDIDCKLYLTNATINLNGSFAKDFSGTFRLPIYYELE